MFSDSQHGLSYKNVEFTFPNFELNLILFKHVHLPRSRINITLEGASGDSQMTYTCQIKITQEQCFLTRTLNETLVNADKTNCSVRKNNAKKAFNETTLQPEVFQLHTITNAQNNSNII